MTPYASFLYFGVLLYPLLPTVLLGLLWRFSWRWVLVATVAMLTVQYWDVSSLFPARGIREFWVVAGYTGLQWAISRAYLWSRTRCDSRGLFCGALLLSVAPLGAARIAPALAPGSAFAFLGLSYSTIRALWLALSGTAFPCQLKHVVGLT